MVMMMMTIVIYDEGDGEDDCDDGVVMMTIVICDDEGGDDDSDD